MFVHMKVKTVQIVYNVNENRIQLFLIFKENKICKVQIDKLYGFWKYTLFFEFVACNMFH